MNIYITLDYELFLNDITGDVDHCLITPTRELLKVLDRHQVKATFFVDMAYIYRLGELRGRYDSLQEDYVKVTSQVKELALRGQKIGLHLHPQWFYSNYNGREWVVDFEHYKLSDMPEMEAHEKFVTCHKLLEEIVGGKVDSFRAGGFSIQTFKAFSSILKECGITKDSTVLYKGLLLSKLHYYDYSSLNNPEVYRFTNNIIEPDTDGEITEYPISTSKMNILTYCYYRYKNHKARSNNNWGNGGDLPANRRSNFVKSLISKMRFSVGIGASIDYQSFFNLDYVYKKYKKNGVSTVVILGHPKNLSPLSIQSLDEFIRMTIVKETYKTI